MESLGAILGCLETKLGRLGVAFGALRLIGFDLSYVGRRKGAQRDAFGKPKWSQNRSENDSKSKSIFKSEKNTLQIILEPSWLDLGPSRLGLGPSWGDLGSAGGAKNAVFPNAFHYF